MTPVDLLWLFIIVTALQPVLKQRWLEATRKRLIAKLERERGSRVVLLVHRQETLSLLGFPVMRYIDLEDSEQILRASHLTDPDVPLDLVVHTPGGLVIAALQVARALQHRRGKVTVIVPHHAMSGGTLIALGADEILMGEHAVLGPVDPQLGHWPAASLLRVPREKPIERVDDETLVLADEAEKALGQVRASVKELLSARMPADKASSVADLLSSGTWTHDYPITADAARELGLPVKTQVPDDFMLLMSLYPQPVKQRPTVEYLPGRRSRDQEPQLAPA